MAHSIVDIPKGEVCPICGHPDWCGYMPIDKYPGKYMIFCFRQKKMTDCIGNDGKVYAFVGQSKNNAVVYEEYEQHRQRLLIENNGWEYSECTSQAPCPVCGSQQGCRSMRHINGTSFSLCMVQRDGKNVVRNGKTYIYTKETSNGKFSRYEEKEERKKRISNWKSGNVSQEQALVLPKFQTPVEQSLTYEDVIPVRENVYLDKIYRYLLDCLVLDPMHKEYMLAEGWTEEMLKKYQIKSFPENDFLRYKYNNFPSHNVYRKNLARKISEKFGEDALMGVPGAYKDRKGNWTFAGGKGVLFPCYDAQGYLYRLRVRFDFCDVHQKVIRQAGKDLYFEQEGNRFFISPMKGIYCLKDGNKCFVSNEFGKKGKYRNFSSWKEDKEKRKEGIIANVYEKGCQAGNALGLYFDESADDMSIAFITEGEKKGIFGKEKMHSPFISLPGVGSLSLLFEGEKGNRPIDILKDKGVKVIVVAFDADKVKNEAVLNKEQALIAALREENVGIGVAEWDILLGKGIDDLLANGHQPRYMFV